jgi:hypothetical protein
MGRGETGLQAARAIRIAKRMRERYQIAGFDRGGEA